LANNLAVTDSAQINTAETESCSGLGPGTTIRWENLPWPTTFTSKGIATFKTVRFTAKFQTLTCVFESKKVKATFEVGLSPVLFNVVTSAQKFKLLKKLSNPTCPKESKVDAGDTVSGEHLGEPTITTELK